MQELLKHRWERLDASTQSSARMVERLYLGEHAGNVFPSEDNTPGVASSLHRDLSGKTLAIYSLMKGAARRGKEALLQLSARRGLEDRAQPRSCRYPCAGESGENSGLLYLR
ncbi:hypothetical protein ACSF64_19860 [Escherichia coli]|uniref:hypothetical protein n=1 Tax=Escherichia coli TaxID=562 RepID=UPI003EEC6B30